MKRAFDLIIALLLAIPALMVCLCFAIPVWIEAKASPFFIQTRLGRNERPFSLLKIRTMHPQTGHVASHEVDRSAILKTGKIIRKLKIDELPQIWNVICGSMSLVGPRPGLPVQTELSHFRRQHNVFSMLPGVTGVSQVAGLDMSTPEALAQMDATYLGEWSLGRDLTILSQTVMGGGRGDAAMGSNKG